MTTLTPQQHREREMFDATVEEMDEAMSDKTPSEIKWAAISMISDVQEMLTLKMDETARRTLNRVKYYLSKS